MTDEVKGQTEADAAAATAGAFDAAAPPTDAAPAPEPTQGDAAAAPSDKVDESSNKSDEPAPPIPGSEPPPLASAETQASIHALTTAEKIKEFFLERGYEVEDVAERVAKFTEREAVSFYEDVKGWLGAAAVKVEKVAEEVIQRCGDGKHAGPIQRIPGGQRRCAQCGAQGINL